MSLFDFITDEDFRTSLVSDHKEMNSCAEAGAWKAVHVLAGSIVEAVLIDHLVCQGLLSKKDALTLDLGKTIKLCRDNNIISGKAADLSSVIREYRNLIHPGRTIRLNEDVSVDSARVAQSVVKILLGEISKQKKEEYGYTAEQIVSKLERDPSASAIIPHLLKETKTTEAERLMLKVLPNRYLTVWTEEFVSDHILPAFSTCFRKAFDLADTKLKKKVAKWLVSIIKEGGETEVLSYSTAFLRASDMEFMSKADVSLVKEHLLSRLGDEGSAHLLTALEGIGAFLVVDDVQRFVDPLIRMSTSDTTLARKTAAAIQAELTRTPSKLDDDIVKRLDAWLNMYHERGESDKAGIVEKLKSVFEKEIPF